jgi:hypothetical protein
MKFFRMRPEERSNHYPPATEAKNNAATASPHRAGFLGMRHRMPETGGKECIRRGCRDDCLYMRCGGLFTSICIDPPFSKDAAAFLLTKNSDSLC